jgi:hypothetical protein
MRNPLITILVLLATIIIIAVVMADYRSTRPGKGPANPFAFSVDEYRSVPPGLVSWEEVRQVKIDAGIPRAIAYGRGNIYLAAGNEIQVIAGDWTRTLRKTFESPPTAIAVADDGRIIISFSTHLAMLDKDGDIIEESVPLSPDSHFTSVAVYDGNIYVADATARKVRIFNPALEPTGEFAGESGVSETHGFIVPGARFSLAVNSGNELWVTNPGLHALQNYTAGGRLRSYLQNSSFGIEGFSGCCNPEYFAFLPGGGFVTSEKGLIRIKVINESGEVLSVVAPGEKFRGGTRAPAVAVDDRGNVLALDFDRSIIRIFEPVKDPP